MSLQSTDCIWRHHQAKEYLFGLIGSYLMIRPGIHSMVSPRPASIQAHGSGPFNNYIAYFSLLHRQAIQTISWRCSYRVLLAMKSSIDTMLSPTGSPPWRCPHHLNDFTGNVLSSILLCVWQWDVQLSIAVNISALRLRCSLLSGSQCDALPTFQVEIQFRQCF